MTTDTTLRSGELARRNSPETQPSDTMPPMLPVAEFVQNPDDPAYREEFLLCCADPQRFSVLIADELLKELAASTDEQGRKIQEVEQVTQEAIEQKESEIAALVAETRGLIQANDTAISTKGLSFVERKDSSIHQEVEGYAGLSSGDRAKSKENDKSYQELLVVEGQRIDDKQKIISNLRNDMLLLAANQEADNTVEGYMKPMETALASAKATFEELDTLPQELREEEETSQVVAVSTSTNVGNEVAIVGEQDTFDPVAAERKRLAKELADTIAALRYIGIINDDGTKSDTTNTDIARYEEYHKKLPTEVCEFWQLCKLYDAPDGRKQFMNPSLAEQFADKFCKVLEVRRNRLDALRARNTASYKKALKDTNDDLKTHVEENTTEAKTALENKVTVETTAARAFSAEQFKHYKTERARLEKELETIRWYRDMSVKKMQDHQVEIEVHKNAVTEARGTFEVAARFLIISEPRVSKLVADLRSVTHNCELAKNLVDEAKDDGSAAGSRHASQQLSMWLDRKDAILAGQEKLKHERGQAQTHRKSSFDTAVEANKFIRAEQPVRLPDVAYDVTGFIKTSIAERQRSIEDKGREEDRLGDSLLGANGASQPRFPRLYAFIMHVTAGDRV